MAKKPKKEKESQVQEKVKFDYIKSQHFRVIHVDGAVGSVTPTGLIHFALYNERAAIPRQTTHFLNPDGTLGDRISEETISRETIIREMDVDVILSVDVAISLRDWLDGKIKEVLERLATQAQLMKKEKGKS